MNAWDKAKITPMDLRPKVMIGDSEGEAYVGRIIGEAYSVKRKLDSQGGETTELVGRFKATFAHPIEADETSVDAIISKRCLLTPSEHAQVVAELRNGVSAVQFAVDIFATKDKKALGGFVFNVKPLFPISGSDSDPLAAVSARVLSVEASETHKGKAKAA